MAESEFKPLNGENMFSKIGLAAIMGFTLLAASWVVTVGFDFVSRSSSAAVVFGVLLLFAAPTVVYYVFSKVRGAFRTLALAALVFGSASCAKRVEPGHAGIKVNLYGSDRGVDAFPLVTGMVWYNPFSTTVLEYPTYVQTATWSRPTEDGGTNEEISFNSREGLNITADVSLSYQLLHEKVPSFYTKFRSDNLDTFTHGFLRNVARDAFNEIATHYTVEELYGAKKEEFLAAARERINAQVDPFGVHMEQLGFVGAMRLPENVVKALNQKIQAIQDAITAENQLRQTQAQAAKDVARAEGDASANVARAKGEAEANRALVQSLTPNLMEWRRLILQQEAIAKWNGTLPVYSLGAGTTPLIQLPGGATK